jgi:low temperature requirement protein LtrA
MGVEKETVGEEQERHATNLELFLDLAFVLSIAQATTFISSNFTPTGILKGVLLTWLIWWLWTAFTWAGAAVNFQTSTKHRVFILFMIPMLLVVAVSLPYAYADLGLWFALSYLVVQVWITLLQGIDAWDTVDTRKAWLSYGPFALIAPIILVTGAFFDDNTRIIIWSCAAAVNIASALFGGRTSKNVWRINASQFTERHCLFIIISLGEVIVAVGVKASSLVEKYSFTFDLGLSVVIAAAIACIYWWTYFAYLPDVLEHALGSVETRRKGQVARDLFSFGHFPIVVSIIFYAVIAKHFLEHPFDPLETTDLVLLALSATLLLGSILHIQWRLKRHLSPQRMMGIVATLILAWCGQYMDAVTTLCLYALLMGTISIIIWFKVKAEVQESTQGKAEK